MANVYVYSAAAGAGTGADWANAYTTLAAALTAKAAGDDFWVAHDHAETQASAMTLTPPGTAASPNRIICVNRAGTVPPVSADLRTTATITTTGASGMIFTGGFAYFEGITFNCGSGVVSNQLTIITTTTTIGVLTFKNCNLSKLGTTANSTAIAIGGTAATASTRVVLINTNLTLGHINDELALRNAEFIWRGGSFVCGDNGGDRISSSAGSSGNATFEGVDLTGINGNGIVFDSLAGKRLAVLKDCKLASGVTICTTPNAGEAEILVIRSDSGDTNYRHEKYSYAGTQVVETTIVRTGGASDGTTPISWKIDTTANSKRTFPFESLPIAIWNETVGSAITLTLEGIWGGGAVPTNADIWLETAYLGTSGFPLGLVASSGPADQLAAGTNLASSSETWGGSTTKFKMFVTITPQEKGPITIYVRAALASSTWYIDPEITVS